MRTVGEVSELAGVTVRTLHHFHEIGLLSPSERSRAGYRLYSYEDLSRLQEILVWRQLGFSLAQIGEMLDEPSHDRLSALERQRELVEHERGRLSAIARALDAALAAHRNGTRLKETTMFDGFDPAEYEDEARRAVGAHRALPRIGTACPGLRRSAAARDPGRGGGDRRGVSRAVASG